MDRHIQDRLEQFLQGLDRRQSEPNNSDFERHLAAADAGTRELVETMAAQSRMLRHLRVPGEEADGLMPAPGFYARVMQQIEAQRPASIWNLFVEPRFFHRLAFATFSLLLLLGLTFLSPNPQQEAPMQARSEPEMILATPEPAPVTSVSQSEGRDVMLRQLTVYSE
ncbi:MAG: hypothetical protein IT164_04385 [Bryobacterales bacterium]|nr:hypothetical protein [Bryobacterales bacterium]